MVIDTTPGDLSNSAPLSSFTCFTDFGPSDKLDREN